MGSSFEALMAGNTPNRTPMPAQAQLSVQIELGSSIKVHSPHETLSPYLTCLIQNSAKLTISDQ